MQTAQILSMLANQNRDPKKKATPYKPDDFMPKWGQTLDVEDEEQFPSLAG